MARKRQRKKSNVRLQRDANVITNRRLLKSRFYNKYNKEPLNDLRRFSPSKESLLTTGLHAETTIHQPGHSKGHNQTKTRVRYSDPLRTTVCIRRKIRRSILFAKKKAGKGKTVNPIRRLNEFSKIKC